jgi:adenylate cyclase
MQDAATTIIARQLVEDDQAKRIYKLLIYVGEGAWVGDIGIPSEAMMQRGLYQVLQSFADYGQLRSHLHTSVNTLSKPAEYSEIADIILEAIAEAHGVSADDPTTTFLPVLPNLSLNEQPSIYSPIAARLVELPNQIRLKKLSFCVAQSVWEGDTSKLEAISWLDLTQALHQRYPDSQDLYKAFQQVVSRLSKPIEYSMLAESVIESLAPLYQSTQPETPAAFIPEDLGQQHPEFTPKAISDPIASDGLIASESIIPAAPWSEGTGSILVEAIEPVIFDLHYDVMKQSNPLRLKHLLLILISNLEPEEAIDSMNLRQQTTIPLLSMAFRIHRKPEILAIKLREIARKLPDPEEYENTIDAILRAFKTRLTAQQNLETTTPKRLPLTDEPAVVTGIR